MRFRHIRAICALMVYPLYLTSPVAALQNSAGARSSAPLTNQDIILMTRSRFDDATIVKTIQAFDTNFDLSVAALMKLKDAGVAQTVIQAMLATVTDRDKARPPERVSSTSTTVSRDSANPREHPAMQLQPGTYYWTQGSWRLMQQLTMSGGGGKHMAKVFVPGLTPQIV